jgi:serine/threonine-protein kinase
MLPPGLAAALAPGTVIGGKYRVEHPLGAGGMGVVVAARHLELNQNLAIKVLLPSASNSEESTTRFLREGRSAAQLTSPHVAKVHDSGRLPSGAPYLVMELLRGRDLRAHLAEVRRVPLALAIEWVLQAAHALGEAHKLNIIHRDVKPANLFLAETSAGVLIKVLDFGVSKHLDDAAEMELTKTTSAVGTPRYMPPEQMRSAKFADTRGDVWSLGVVLYELTTGEPPFKGDTITALCFDVMERTPTPPSQVNPELPPALDEVLARCLEKDPEQRFQSMGALAAALGAIAPSARSSGLFNTAAMQSAGPISGATPVPVVSTPNGASQPQAVPQTQPFPPTVTFPLTRPPFPEVPPPQETLRTWNTPAPRSSTKRASKVPLVALGIGIGIAAATVAGMFLGDREPQNAVTTAAPPPPPSTSPSIVVPEATAIPESIVVPADPPPLSSSVASAPSTSAAPEKRRTVDPCKPPIWIDKDGFERPKPWCGNK